MQGGFEEDAGTIRKDARRIREDAGRIREDAERIREDAGRIWEKKGGKKTAGLHIQIPLPIASGGVHFFHCLDTREFPTCHKCAWKHNTLHLKQIPNQVGHS